MNRITKVRKWAETLTTDNKTALEWCFTNLAFGDIYIPVKTPTSEGMPENYTYVNIGMTPAQMVDTYNTLYGENYLTEELINNSDFYMQSVLKLQTQIRSIYLHNYGKYKKLIELQGFVYNPLYNVDGVEEYTSLGNEGTNDITVSRAKTQYTDSTTSGNTRSGSISDSGSSAQNHSDTNTVSSFDSDTLVNESGNSGNQNVTSASNTQTFNNLTDSGTGSITYGAHTDTDTTTITHHNALNGESDYSGGVDAFGNTVTGGDKYHTEKRIRKGNIGVTKTQELVEAERNNLRFSVIQEFFEDINKVLLVGIYDI